MLDKVGRAGRQLGDSTGRLPTSSRCRACVAAVAMVARRSLARCARDAALLATGAMRRCRRRHGELVARRRGEERATPRPCAALLQQRADVNAAGSRRHDGAALGRASRRPRDGRPADRAGAERRGARIATASTPLYLAAINGNAAIIERLLKAGADPNTALPRRRDGADDGGAHRQRRGGQGAAGARRRRQRDGELEGTDGADVGGGREQRDVVRALIEAGADLDARSKGGGSRRSCSPCAPGTSTPRARCSTPAPTSTRRCPTARARWCSRSTNAHYELAGAAARPRRRPERRRARLDGAAPDRVDAPPNNGFNLPGPVPTGQPRRLELVRKLVAARRRPQRAPDEGADATATATCSNRDRRDAVPARGQSGRPAADAGAARARRRSDAADRGRHDAADGGGGRRHLGAGREPGTDEEALAAVKLRSSSAAAT